MSDLKAADLTWKERAAMIDERRRLQRKLERTLARALPIEAWQCVRAALARELEIARAR